MAGRKLRSAISKSRRKSRFVRSAKKQWKKHGDFKNYIDNDPFPPRREYQLTYFQKERFFSSASVTDVFGAESIFSLNSLFDPDIGSIGHQPYGYDQLTLLYHRYKVNKVKIDVTYYNPSVDGMVCGAMLTANNSTTTLAGQSITQATELPFVVTRTLNNTGIQRTKISQTISIAEMVGVTRQQFDANINAFTGNTAGPAVLTQPKLRIAIANTDGTSTVVNVDVKITYFATFWDRKVLPRS